MTFCKNCKYRVHVENCDDQCFHPSQIVNSYNWLEMKQESISLCAVRNRNNDCLDYQEDPAKERRFLG